MFSTPLEIRSAFGTASAAWSGLSLMGFHVEKTSLKILIKLFFLHFISSFCVVKVIYGFISGHLIQIIVFLNQDGTF